MADKRITQLELLTNPKGSDAFAIVDTSVPETKQVTYGQLTASIQGDLVDVSTGSLLITSSRMVSGICREAIKMATAMGRSKLAVAW